MAVILLIYSASICKSKIILKHKGGRAKIICTAPFIFFLE